VNPLTLAAQPRQPGCWKDGVYAGSFASTIEFIQPDGRHEVTTTAGNWIWGTPALDGETLYYADLDGKIYSLDLATSVRIGITFSRMVPSWRVRW
jgi:outer membrane protein assembly factor BamB